jgi:Asp-tRNA(Asn)/Glu-tRNA(Gln) amidotransferase B subunit
MFDNIVKNKINAIIKKSINNNSYYYYNYKKGQKGLIGFFINDVIKKSDIYFDNKNIQQLIIMIKNQLNKN